VGQRGESSKLNDVFFCAAGVSMLFHIPIAMASCARREGWKQSRVLRTVRGNDLIAAHRLTYDREIGVILGLILCSDCSSSCIVLYIHQLARCICFWIENTFALNRELAMNIRTVRARSIKSYTCERFIISIIWTNTRGIFVLTPSNVFTKFASKSSGCKKLLSLHELHRSFAPIKIERSFQSSATFIFGFDFNWFTPKLILLSYPPLLEYQIIKLMSN